MLAQALSVEVHSIYRHSRELGGVKVGSALRFDPKLAIERAMLKPDEPTAKAKVQSLPDALTPQSLRRTFASLLFAVGESSVYVKGQLGHTDATLTLNYYAGEMDRRDGEPERLKALVEGRVWTHLDSKAPDAATRTGDEDTLEPVKSAILPE